MRRSFLAGLFSFCVVIALAALSAASLMPDDFKYTAQIQGPIKKNVIYQIHLSSEILKRCPLGCNDLRIFDANANEIPYVIIESRQTDEGIVPYPLEVIGYIENSGIAALTMRLPEKYEPLGEIRIETRDRDFKKNIIVYGSNDMKKWTFLRKDTIFDFLSQVDLRKTTIKLNGTNYRYYRLELLNTRKSDRNRESIRLRYNGLDFTIVGQKTEKLHIDKIWGIASYKGEQTVFDGVMLPNFTSNLDTEKNTVVFFRTDLPFDRVALEISNPYYFRTAALYASDTGKKDSYILMANAPLYQFSFPNTTPELKNYFEGGRSLHKFYKIVIVNKSNPPLEIKGITLQWIRRNLYFVGLNDSPAYTLRFQAPAAERPDYDLINFINQSNWHKRRSEHLEISEIHQNGSFKPGVVQDKKTKIEKNILTATVVLLVLIIGYWLYSLIRKTDSKK